MDKQFWEEKYSNHQTGWDIGHISTPLKTYIDQLDNKGLTILIPGAGNAYEAEYLVRHGFKNVTIVDWVETTYNPECLTSLKTTYSAKIFSNWMVILI